jgi:hypothetical protein
MSQIVARRIIVPSKQGKTGEGLREPAKVLQPDSPGEFTDIHQTRTERREMVKASEKAEKCSSDACSLWSAFRVSTFKPVAEAQVRQTLIISQQFRRETQYPKNRNAKFC